MSPEQKRRLKQRAQAAGLSVSAYVLERALPSVNEELETALQSLRNADDLLRPLGTLSSVLSSLADDDFLAAADAASLDGLDPLRLNCVAALVETEALRRAVPIPGWCRSVAPLSPPWFAWRLRALRPHLMRVTPAAFKRRGVYLDLWAREAP